jgi:hypothetical protein
MLAIFGMPRVPQSPSPEGDDDLDDLPPIDGDGDGGESSEWTPDLDEDGSSMGDDAESDASLDDTTSEGDPPDTSELEGDEGESGWVDEADDSADLDLGDAGLLDSREESGAMDDAEEPLLADDEFGIGENAERVNLDSEEEGPLDVDEQLREEDLPAMDADDDDQEPKPEEAGLLDERFVGDEPLGLPWAADPWEPVGPPGGLSWVGLSGGATAIACASRGALVAGRTESGTYELIRVDLEGTRQVLPGEGLEGGRILALAVEGDVVAAVGEGGRLLLSRDGGALFERPTVTDGVAAADVVLALRVLWVRTRTGSLLAGRRGKAIERCPVPGTLVGLARNGVRGVLGLAVDEEGRAATILRGGADATAACEAVQVPYGRPSSVIAARGEHVAYVAPSAKGGIVRRGPDGIWRRFPWEGRVTAITFVDDGGTLIAATYSDADDTTGLVRLDAAGRAAVVARVGAVRGDADADGRAVAIACDDPRGVVWVAGGFGVAAFAIR